MKRTTSNPTNLSTNLVAGTLTSPQKTNFTALAAKLVEFQESAPTILSSSLSAGQFSVQLTSIDCVLHSLWRNDNLASTNWTRLTNAVPATTNGIVQLTDTNASGARRFYRVSAGKL